MSGQRFPDFILIGATKCGTTSLHRWLRGHPNVFIPSRKELRYFTTQHNYHRGPDWYASWFGDAAADSIVGEASNAYTRHPVYDGVPSRIAELLPEVKLIYLVRDPLRRLESHYRHRLVTGKEWRRPEAAIARDPSYLAAGLYGAQLAEYRKHFRPDQILILNSERLFSHSDSELPKVAAFLGVDCSLGLALEATNVTSERLVAPHALRYLSAFKPAKQQVKTLARRIRRSAFRHLLMPAGQPDFELREETLRVLARRFEEDRCLIEELAGPDVATWRTPGPD